MIKFITFLMLSTFIFASPYAHARDGLSDLPYEIIDSRENRSTLRYVVDVIKPQVESYIKNPFILGGLVIPSFVVTFFPFSPAATVLIGITAEIGLIHYALGLFSDVNGQITATTAISTLTSSFLCTALALNIGLKRLTTPEPMGEPMGDVHAANSADIQLAILAQLIWASDPGLSHLTRRFQ